MIKVERLIDWVIFHLCGGNNQVGGAWGIGIK